jgi:hypothetical protein
MYIMEEVMAQNKFHGILVNMAFDDSSFPTHFKLFAQQTAGDWVLYGIVVLPEHLDESIALIQTNMREDEPFYAHLYDDEKLVVIFKKKIFLVTSHSSSWGEIQRYGQLLNIPQEQLDFWPNRFQDEPHYFEPSSFIGQ